MQKHINSYLKSADLPSLLRFSVRGAIIAGGYGILHDQVTFTLGPEYFHNFKFRQFSYADFGFGDRIFASSIGFLASWWVGLIVGLILAHRCLPHQLRSKAHRQIWLGFAVVFATTLISGLAGYGYGTLRGPNADHSAWQSDLYAYNITDQYSFMRIAYIHNASYIGAFFGIALANFVIRPAASPPKSKT